MPTVDFGELKQSVRDIYESKHFPLYCLFGGSIIYAFTGDWLWLPIGIGLFLLFFFRRRHQDG